jgi:hypothetical protein
MSRRPFLNNHPLSALPPVERGPHSYRSPLVLDLKLGIIRPPISSAESNRRLFFPEDYKPPFDVDKKERAKIDLMIACWNGDTKKVDKILGEGCDFSYPHLTLITPEGETFLSATPLWIAVYRNNPEILQKLLEDKTVSHFGEDAFGGAAMLDKFYPAIFAADGSAEPSFKGRSILQLAVERASPENTKILEVFVNYFSDESRSVGATLMASLRDESVSKRVAAIKAYRDEEEEVDSFALEPGYLPYLTDETRRDTLTKYEKQISEARKKLEDLTAAPAPSPSTRPSSASSVSSILGHLQDRVPRSIG